MSRQPIPLADSRTPRATFRSRPRASAPVRRRNLASLAALEQRVLPATNPAVLSIVRAMPLGPFTSATSVSYTVTFDRPVTGVAPADFRLTESNGGLQAQTPVVVTGSGATYTVQVNGVHGSGDLRLDLIDDDSIKDSANNPLGGPGAGNGSFQGQTYTIDQTAPAVVSIAGTTPALGTTSASSLSYTVTFNQPVTGVGPTDFALATSGNVSGNVTDVTPVSSSVYNVTVGGITGSGTLGLNLADNGSIMNLAGTSLTQSTGDGSFLPATTFAAGSAPVAVAVGDLNGDGTPDLVVANFSDNTVSVLLGKGDGKFLPQTTYATGAGPVAVAIADLNGDGKPDLVVANSQSNSLSVVLGNGDGTFQAATTYATGSSPNAVAVGDLNGDGKPDLVVANFGDNNVGVLLGNGDGTFQPQTTYATGSNPASVAIGDLNGDGKPDLVVANAFSNNVSVLRGKGDGTFLTQVQYPVSTNPFGVALGDFNGDGTLDVVTANLGSNDVSVLLGNGDGTLLPQTRYATGTGPISVSVADMNGGGTPDIVVANATSNTLGVLPGNGDGTFQPQTTYSTGTGSNPNAVAIADLNGDGKPDLIAANVGTNSVGVLLGSASDIGQVYTIIEPTTTAVVVGSSPSTYGQSATFTATVMAEGSPATGGSVTFSEGSTVLAAAVPLDASGQARFSISTLSATASPHVITAVYSGSSSDAASSATTSLAINPAALTVTGIKAISRVYDGTTTAALDTSLAALAGVVAGDMVTLTTAGATGTFATKDVAASDLVTIAGLALGGTGAGNYTLVPPTAVASVTPRPLTGSIVVADKVYDGTTAATITGRSLSGVVAADVALVSLTGGTATFSDKNAGSGKTVSATGLTLAGAAQADYSVSPTATTTAAITPRVLVISATGVNKVYDGTTSATVALTDNRLAGDQFSGTYTSAGFADKNAGAGKAVAVAGLAINGADAANYTLASTTAAATATITPRLLTVTAAGVNKVYDGTTTAMVTFADNRVAGDVLAETSASALFSDRTAGASKPVAVAGIAVSGTDAANYSLGNTTAATTASITPRALVVTATGIDKIYDGTLTATVTLADNRVAGDVFTETSAPASFTDKNVGTGKAVAVSGLAITGTDAGNYSLASTTAATTASITPRAVVVSATGINKVYDGTPAATVLLSDNRVTGDVFTDVAAAATFADKNVASNKPVAVSGITISGADAANYRLTTNIASATASITPAPLVITATGVNKVYDGTPAATVLLSDNRVTGDALGLTSASASFADKNVGTGKSVSVMGLAVTGADSGNYSLASTTAATTASITPRSLTVAAAGIDKVYDGTTAAAATLTDNRLPGDMFTVVATSTTFADKNVGLAKAVTAAGLTLTGADAANYSLSSTTAATTASITPRALTVTATGINKVYDGTILAAVTLTDNRVAGDALSISGASASFADKNVGAGKSVSVTNIALAGTDAANYSLTSTTAATSASITPRALTVAATGINKVYDGTTAAAVTLTDNRVAGDALSITDASASFADKKAGAGKPVAVAGIAVSGADAGNYHLASTTASTTASITPAALVVSATGVNKVYDGTATATVLLADNRVAGDALSITNTSASFADKNVGTGKAVSVMGIAVTGTDAVNYSLTNTTTATSASITPRALVVSATGVDKVYDGSTAATVLLADNRISGDVFTEAALASFADKNVGAGKTVSVTNITLAGADAANYSLTSTTAATSASITPRALTIAATALDKVYDGTTLAAVTLADNRIAGDLFTVSSAPAQFTDKNVGTGKTVTVTGIVLAGADAANYRPASTTATASAGITPRALTVIASAADKVYDGTPLTTVSFVDNRVSGDAVTETALQATFPDKNVGLARGVAVSGITHAGADAANYRLTSTSATTTASITPRSLAVTVTSADKVYDGTTLATVTLTDDRVAGDVFSDAFASARFADKNVGTGKAVTVAGIALTGPDAGNYVPASTTVSAQAAITPRALTVTALGVDKVYDGTTLATVILADDRLSGDLLADSAASATFADKNAGAGKTVSVTGITLAGADAANYSLTSSTAGTNASVTPRSLTVAATAANKVYDGTPNAVVTLTDDRIPGDSLGVTSATASFADKNAGTSKAVTVAGLAINGNDAGNYTLALTTTSTTADITPRPLAIDVAAVDKVYDGTPAATVTLTDDRIAGDVLATSALASFADKNVGPAKTVSVANIALAGADFANYRLTSTTATTTASITPRSLAILATGLDKVYDGTTTAAVTLTDNRLAGDVLTDGFGVASFADKNVGTGKTVAVAGLTITGADAANYRLTSTTAATSASITPRALTIAATALDKVYDGTTLAAVTLSDNRIAGDALTDGSGPATFADSAVGDGKIVTVPDLAITGTDAANYGLANQNTTATASITPRTLTVTATGVDKVYDGTPAATVVFTDNRLAGDTFTVISQPAAFADRHVGAARPVTVTGIALNGPAAGNYALASTTMTASASITPAPLTISADDRTMVYGAPLPGLSASFHGLVNGDSPQDVLDLALSTVPATSHTGTYAIAAAGALDPDYTIQLLPGTLTITPAALTIVADDQSAVVGSAAPPLTAHYLGFVNGDSAASLSSGVQLNAPDPRSVAAGNYPIVASGARSPDYVIQYVNGTLTVAPARLPAAAPVRTATDFVTSLYTGILNRSPDPPGLHYWRRRLLKGMPPVKVARAFEQSHEHLRMLQPAQPPRIPRHFPRTRVRLPVH